jgi:uncharacterized membrane protein YkvA (DUF1232 family)
MNASISIPNPLPAILYRPFIGMGRRHRINGFDLSEDSVDRFNQLLARLGRQDGLDRDQLVSAARELCDRSILDSAPACIRERLTKIATVEQMVADGSWASANDTVNTAKTVVDYARGHDDLIPDWLPKVGRLDDAIVVETAWPQLAAEVDDYLDFCRLRALEARQRDCTVDGFAFTRSDWEQARYDEMVFAEHERKIRETSYLPSYVPLFFVH